MSPVTFATKVVIFWINVARFFKFKLDDEMETEILKTIESAVETIFG